MYRKRKLDKLKVTNPKAALDCLWKWSFKYSFPWDNPQNLNEKITWMMHRADTTKWTELSDKYKMRAHLEKLGLGDYLPKLYGHWERAEEINFDAMPEKFVLKCNHDCGSAVIVDKKIGYDKLQIISFLNDCVSKPYGIDTIEPHYVGIPRLIIAEEFIENTDKDISSTIIDWKFWCFDGEPYCAFVCLNRDVKNKHADFQIYHINPWQLWTEYANIDISKYPPISKPKNMDTMLELCRKLSAGLPYLRLDLYEAGDRVFVGEMTFTSAGGRMTYFSQKALNEMGAKVHLPNSQ